MDGIVITEYNPAWPFVYETERALLAEAFGSYALDIQHVGSTSVPGLAAKPIIDIGVAIQQYPLPDPVIQAVVNLGYEHMGEYGVPRRHYFRRDNPRTHHVHALEIDGEEWVNHILFRDYLRTHPDEARRYEILKRALAVQYAHDRGTYTDSKTPFIKDVLNRARMWHNN